MREVKQKPAHLGYNDHRGRQGWHLKAILAGREEYVFYENGKPMEAVFVRVSTK